jgi:hypothetical protein
MALVCVNPSDDHEYGSTYDDYKQTHPVPESKLRHGVTFGLGCEGLNASYVGDPVRGAALAE